MIAAEMCPDRLAHHITPMTLYHTDLGAANYIFTKGHILSQDFSFLVPPEAQGIVQF